MGALNDLISKVQDTELRKKLTEEAKRLSKQKKFGLVFEEHIPECTPLWDISVKRGSLVSKKKQSLHDTFVVQSIDADNALCFNEQTKETETIPIAELVSVARFGEAIYPYLKPMDTVCHAPESDLWHTLIEADNYHALQFLEYLYAGKVDCIYIDPPYNTGAKDWKYNNDYVDAADAYRHSKWLSMMEKRLKLAKKLLNPQNSALIVTIDEKEYLHLGCLLEELFPNAFIQMVSSVISSHGSARDGHFSRADEYIFYIFIGSAEVCKSEDDMLNEGLSESKSQLWFQFVRCGKNGYRTRAKSLFYPIYIDAQKGVIVSIGSPIDSSTDKSTIVPPTGQIAMWPIDTNGNEMTWATSPEIAQRRLSKGLLRLGKTTKNEYGWSLMTVREGTEKRIESGEVKICGLDERGGAILIDEKNSSLRDPKTVWNKTSHNAGWYGSKVISQIIPGRTFAYPKSIYSTHDAIRFLVANKPNALIVDFFAGSGTTLHAVNLLNAEDGGHRRCIMVTNNEVSESEAKSLRDQGHHPGDPEWEKYGIARYVNWPRTVCSIEGHDINGNALTGEYLTTQKKTVEVNRKITQIAVNGDALPLDAKKSLISLLKEKIPQKALTDNSHYILSENYTSSIIFDSGFVDEWLEQLPENPHVEDIYIVTETKRAFDHLKQEILAAMPPLTREEPVNRPMVDGFPANAAFFKLSFLDKNAIALGRQFAEMLPTLWMKAGAIGPCPVLPDSNVPDMLMLPENHFAVLTEETSFPKLLIAKEKHPELKTIYIITDYEAGFQRMSQNLPGCTCYQLYRDYLDNFRINTARQ